MLPHDVLAYLRRYSAGVPRDVVEADVLDGLLLKLRLWWLAGEAEWWLLERGRAIGVAPGRIRRVLGIRTRQGVHDRLRHARRKAALLAQEPSRGHPGGTYEQRHHDLQARWLSANRGAVQDLAHRALALQDLAGDELAEWLVEVARDLADDAVTPASLQILRVALEELQVDEATEQPGRTPDRDDLLSGQRSTPATRPPGRRGSTRHELVTSVRAQPLSVLRGECSRRVRVVGRVRRERQLGER